MLPKKLKRKRWIFFVVFNLIFSLTCPNTAYSASLTQVKDILNDSDLGVAANHTIHFMTSIDIGNNGYYEITIPSGFGDVSDADCSGANATVSTTTNSIRCTYSSSPGAATSTYIYINNLINPNISGNKVITITTHNSSNIIQESGTLSVFFVEDVTISAHVTASLEFGMSSTTDISIVNGIEINGSSTATTLPFGTINPSSSTTLAHTLTMATNAENGYSCTVQQDMDLTNQNGKTINSFDNSPDNTGSSTPHTWRAPLGDAYASHTFGHLGVTTDDANLSNLDFSGSKYIGLNGTSPTEIMYHDSRADGKTQNIGKAHIAYTLEINPMQEPGEYETSFTYICTCNY